MKRHKLATLLTLLMLLCACATAAGQEKKLTGDEIINKHLEAVGGREAIARLKTRVALGTVKKENEPEGRMAIMSEAPNRVSVVYDFRDYTLRMVYDGQGAALRPTPPRQFGQLTDKYYEMMGSGLMFNGIALYNLLAAGAPGALRPEAKGTKKVEGRPAYVVQVKPQKGSPMRLYFDAENFMWVRTDYGKASVSKEMGQFTNDVENRAANELTVDFYIETSDFRDVDGVKLPFQFEQVMSTPFLRQSSAGTILCKISQYQHNIQIDPAMFK